MLTKKTVTRGQKAHHHHYQEVFNHQQMLRFKRCSPYMCLLRMYKQETHLLRAFGSLRWSQAVTAIHFHSASEISSVYCPFENPKIYPTDQS